MNGLSMPLQPTPQHRAERELRIIVCETPSH